MHACMHLPNDEWQWKCMHSVLAEFRDKNEEGRGKSESSTPMPLRWRQRLEIVWAQVKGNSAWCSEQCQSRIYKYYALGFWQSAIIQLVDDEDEPLPNPFKFPKFLLELQQGSCAKGAVAVMLFKEAAKHTAHAMYGYCNSVSKQERERVEKYPKLTSRNLSCPYVSLARLAFLVCA